MILTVDRTRAINKWIQSSEIVKEFHEAEDLKKHIANTYFGYVLIEPLKSTIWIKDVRIICETIFLCFVHKMTDSKLASLAKSIIQECATFL